MTKFQQHLEDDRNAEASPKSLSRSGADFCESQVQNSN
jgi:hypothetical protein